jgi:hypothetical protein
MTANLGTIHMAAAWLMLGGIVHDDKHTILELNKRFGLKLEAVFIALRLAKVAGGRLKGQTEASGPRPCRRIPSLFGVGGVSWG